MFQCLVRMLKMQNKVLKFVSSSYWWRQIFQQLHTVTVRLLFYFRLCSLHHPKMHTHKKGLHDQCNVCTLDHNIDMICCIGPFNSIWNRFVIFSTRRDEDYETLLIWIFVKTDLMAREGRGMLNPEKPLSITVFFGLSFNSGSNFKYSDCFRKADSLNYKKCLV